VAAPPIVETVNQLLNPAERAAWIGFVRSHSALLRRLDADLRRSHGISISAYEALIVIGQSDTGSLQMSDLADRTLLTKAGSAVLSRGWSATGWCGARPTRRTAAPPISP